MNKQDFVLNELEAMAKDIEAMVSQERKLLEMEEVRRVEREAESKAEGKYIAPTGRPYNADKFIPEISWFQARLATVKEYLTTEASDQIAY